MSYQQDPYAGSGAPPQGAWPNTGQYNQAPVQPYAQVPGYVGAVPAGPPAANYGWGVAALIFFWPLCIPSFIAASKVNSLYAMGDMAGAYKASADAKKWGRMGLIVGLVLGLITIAFTVVFSMIMVSGY